MKDQQGSIKTEQKDIADVFADFYEELYSQSLPQGCEVDENKDEAIPAFAITELESQICALKKGKARDRSGIVAEIVKNSGKELRSAVLDMFNEILSRDIIQPRSWATTMIQVLYKDGDQQLPQNYRPIAIVQILYKLFTRMVLARIRPHLEAQQSRDQAGFRSYFSTEDHLMTFVLLQEKCLEWRNDLWIAAVDFKKAFDTVAHTSLWNALSSQGVGSKYVHLIAKLYLNQVAALCVDKVSREFQLLRGVKQGDPMSPALFNAVSEDIFRYLK